jgi:hypothetical protein
LVWNRASPRMAQFVVISGRKNPQVRGIDGIE